MITVFQRETGGFVRFSIDTSIPMCMSGYVDVYGPSRTVSRFYGITGSGELVVSKSGLSQLAPGYYTALPQVLDYTDKRYFLALDDLQIIEVLE
jgi:hypothetical protein